MSLPAPALPHPAPGACRASALQLKGLQSQQPGTCNGRLAQHISPLDAAAASVQEPSHIAGAPEGARWSSCCRGRHLEAVVPDEETALLEQPEVGEPPLDVLTMLQDPADSLSDDFEGNRTGQQAMQAGLEAAAESPKHGAAPPHKPMMSTRQLRQHALAQLAKSDTFRRWGLGRCLCVGRLAAWARTLPAS